MADIKNIAKWILIGLIILVGFIIVVSVVTGILVTFALFNLNLSFAGTITIFMLVTLAIATILGLSFAAIVSKFIGNATSNNVSAFLTKITFTSVSVFTVWFTGILLTGAGSKLLLGYSLPYWVSITTLVIGILLFLWVNRLAIEYVAPIKNNKWGGAVVIAVFLLAFLNAVPNYYRRDFYSMKDGSIKVHITPSTGKIWRNKSDYIKYDPRTGEKIRLATEAEVEEAQEKKGKRGITIFSPISAKAFQPSSTQPSFEIKREGTYKIELAQGEMTNWIKIPPGYYYDLSSPTNDDWEVWFWEGEKFIFGKDQPKFTRFPKKYEPIFKISVLNLAENRREKTFILKVWPKKG